MAMIEMDCSSPTMHLANIAVFSEGSPEDMERGNTGHMTMFPCTGDGILYLLFYQDIEVA